LDDTHWCRPTPSDVSYESGATVTPLKGSCTHRHGMGKDMVKGHGTEATHTQRQTSTAKSMGSGSGGGYRETWSRSQRETQKQRVGESQKGR
jgi:hypothetical protein